MLEIEKYLFKERFYTKYLHQVSYLFDACAHHTAVVQYITIYITATAVYLTQLYCTLVIVQNITTSLLLLSTAYCIIAMCVVVV